MDQVATTDRGTVSGGTCARIREGYRHYKPILAIGAGADLLTEAGIPLALASGEVDPGLLVMADAGGALPKFVSAIGKHRHFERHADPPMV